jgi:hypothetical protein
MEQMFPDDNPQDDTHHHNKIRKQTEQPLNTLNDKEFTQEDVGQVIVGLKQKKAPGPNGITNEVVKLIFKVIPKTIPSIYNECLRKGNFPDNWKVAKLIPIIKPGKEGVGNPSKYRPISLLNT